MKIKIWQIPEEIILRKKINLEKIYNFKKSFEILARPGPVIGTNIRPGPARSMEQNKRPGPAQPGPVAPLHQGCNYVENQVSHYRMPTDVFRTPNPIAELCKF